METRPAGEDATVAALRQENERLRLRLSEAEQTLDAIRCGEVDSLVVDGPQGIQVYALEGSGNAYRVLLESMGEGAATLSEFGVILYCNGRLASLLEMPLQRVMGASFGTFVATHRQAAFESLLTRDEGHAESSLRTADGVEIPVYLSSNAIQVEGRKTICLIVVDLRMQKHAEALAAAKLAAEESEARRRLASEVARVGSFEWDLVRDVNRWSPELEALYGLAPGTFEGTYDAWTARIHADDVRAVEAALRRALDTGSFQAEFRTVWPNGTIRWLEGRATVVRDAAGRPARMVGANVDVTERCEAEERYRATFNQAAVGVAEVGLDGRWLRANVRLCAIMGYAKEELERMTVQDIAHPEDRETDAALLRELSAGARQTHSMEKRCIRKDGSIVWTRFTVSLVHRASGAPDYYISVVEDIDSEKRAMQQRDAYENALIEERAFLQRVLRSIPVGVAFADTATHEISFSNDAFARILGGAPTGPGGTAIGACEAPFARALDRADEVRGEEICFEHPSGRHLALRVSAIPLRDVQGTQTGAVLVVDDVTEQRNTARFAEQFVGILGHDLRNPLGAIRMSALLLKRTIGENKHVDRVLSTTERMTNMVDQILDLTRSRLGGGIPLNRKPMALNDAVARAVDELRLIHPAREIHCTTAPDVRGEWDGQRLMQVVSNLVGNAIQHGDPTRPVDVRLAPRGLDAVLEVHSFGPPIPADLVPVLFDAYRRGETRGRQSEGLGLGLFITQQIVLAHGGRIEVVSSDVKGTTFTVTLPRRPASH